MLEYIFWIAAGLISYAFMGIDGAVAVLTVYLLLVACAVAFVVLEG